MTGHVPHLFHAITTLFMYCPLPYQSASSHDTGLVGHT